LKETIKSILALFLGILFIVAVGIGYGKDVAYMGEYCFISGLFAGIVLITSAIFGFNRKTNFPQWVILACVTDILVILLATIILHLNLEGAFWFIHIINPSLLLIYWFFFYNCRKNLKLKQAAVTVIFPLVYLVFAFGLWKATGTCPFPASIMFIDQRVETIILYLLGLILLLVGLGYSVWMINYGICKRYKKTI